MKKSLLILLGLTVAVQLWVPASMILKHERVLREGELFRLRTQPFDPADPFQGRYVWLQFINDYIPGENEKENAPEWREKAYVVLTTDDEGFCKLASWQRERPAEGAYLKLKSQGPAYTWDKDKQHYNGVRFTFPFNKFYMDEAKAPVAETIVREGGRSTNCWANIRVLDGVGLIEDVMVGGVSIRELAQDRLDRE